MGIFGNLFGKKSKTVKTEGSAMASFEAGDFFYDHENASYNLYKVLKVTEGEPFIHLLAYWGSDVKPDTANLSSYELRNACESYGISGLENPVFVTNKPVTEDEMQSYQDWLKMIEGIQNKATQLAATLKEADRLVAGEQYEEAMHLYTEATSFSKFRFSTFDKRGFCFLKLGRFSEAIADLEHSLSLFKEGKDSLYYCAQAYYYSGNYPHAIAKLEQLIGLEENYGDARAFLEMVKGK